jgi:hypothetical protein
LLHCGLLLLAALADLPVGAADPGQSALPAWQVLEYEQQAFFVTARSRVEVTPEADSHEFWRLQANSSVAGNSEEVALELAAADNHLRYRSRLSKGKGERYKTYEFLPEHIRRVRHDPPADTELPPCRWPVSSRKDIPYPPLATGMVVTDAYALLILAGRFQASAAATMEVVVYTEFNFYRVRMTHGDSAPIEVNYQVAGAPAVTGRRPTQAVALQVTPLGEPVDKPDFSLLGLNGDITVLFDQASGLPLQLRGNAPRIGRAEINLKTVTLRDPAA